MRVESPEKTILYEHLIFSNVNDQTGALLDTIVRKVRHKQAGIWRA